MKISNKILWFGLGALFGGMFMSLVFFRISIPAVPAHAAVEDMGEFSDEIITKTHDLAHFDQVKASGNLEMILTRNDKYHIKITGPEYLLLHMDVRKNGRRLKLGLKRYVKSDNTRLKVEISLPALERLKISGAVHAHLAGFETHRLGLSASGATRITGKNNKIGYLTINGSGTTNLEFFDNPVITAQVDLSGASLVCLTMTHGDLRGKISGSGKVVYQGSLDHQDVQIAGAGSVSRKRPDDE